MSKQGALISKKDRLKAKLVLGLITSEEYERLIKPKPVKTSCTQIVFDTADYYHKNTHSDRGGKCKRGKTKFPNRFKEKLC